MPILKQLVSHSSQSKRRSRADLTAEMISAPLGDFRHTMHVGRGGDAFGDTSFLSTRSGEAPPPPEPRQDSPGPKQPGLLSRTFRSSKRSQSINRGDGYEAGPPGAPVGPAPYVKNAISMPVLTEDHAHFGQRLPKSASSGPPRRPEAPPPPQPRSSNGGGAVAMATLDPEFDERGFGELGEWPPPMPRGGGMRPAESIMSFSIDLGPSMLGDILSVMEKKGWDDADLGYEEGGASPPLGPASSSEEEGWRAPPRPQTTREELHMPERRATGRRRSDSCSSSDSAPDERAYAPPPHGDADSARYSAPRGEEEQEFSFMDDDEDDEEIRV